MKKINGVFCIAIAVALLVGGVGAVSASIGDATTNQDIAETIEVTVSNAIAMTGNVGDDLSLDGNTITQTIDSSITQTISKWQLAGIIQLGDYNEIMIDLSL